MVKEEERKVEENRRIHTQKPGYVCNFALSIIEREKESEKEKSVLSVDDEATLASKF